MNIGDEIHIVDGRFAGRFGKVRRVWGRKQDIVIRLHDAAHGEPKVIKLWVGEVEPLSAIDQLARLARSTRKRRRA